MTDRAILLTPPGAGAIAVVRVAGPGVRSFLERHFTKGVPAPGRCVHGELRDGDRVVDDPVVVVGPDAVWADVNVHGGAWVVRRLLELAARAGFEVSDRPDAPLPPDAVEGEDEIEREVLRYLPLARTELALRVLLAQPAAWTRVGEYGRDDVLADRSLTHLLYPPRVAIVGVPNVGKSTLANQLFGQERSITADLPGTTRDWVGELANVDGLAVMLVDTPGVRQTTDAIEHAAIGRAAAEVSGADLVVVVLDVTMPLEAGQQQLLARFSHALRVANKVDAAPAWDANSIHALRVVARTGEGVDTLRALIRRHFGCDQLDLARPRCWTPRQRAALAD